MSADEIPPVPEVPGVPDVAPVEPVAEVAPMEPAPGTLAPLPRRQPPQVLAQRPDAPEPKRGTAAWFAWKKAQRAHQEMAREMVAELERNGTTARVLAAHEKLKSPFFNRSVQAAIKKRETEEGPLKVLDPVRGMAMRILAEEFGCDLAGVNVQTRWDPATKRLSFKAEPSIPAMAAAAREIGKRKSGRATP